MTYSINSFCFLFIFSYFLSFSQTATPPSSGDGSIGNPYQISTINNLYWITQNSSEWNKYYIQINNIDASSTSSLDFGSGFSPIGNGSSSFTGSYDGCGYTISGLFISRNSDSYIAMFGLCSDATIKNLILTNINFSGNDYVGGIVGAATGSGSFLLENCSSAGNIYGVTSKIGGLIGSTQAGSTINKCYSTVNVSSINGNYLGGFIGHNFQSSTINNCYSSGNVSSINGNQVGGFAGVNQSATINNCYCTGNASGAGSFVGGFVGAVASSIVNNSFWDTQSSGNSTSAAGTGKTTAEMKIQSTFTDAGWDFTNVWEIVGGDGANYPRLKNNPDPALAVELSMLNAVSEISGVKLRWRTETEVNNYGFEIERRALKPLSQKADESSQLNGSTARWLKTGFVQGAGTSNSPKEYSYTDSKLTAGRYEYRLKQIDLDGNFKYSQSIEVKIGIIPAEFALYQNYPNPFNPSTTIKYDIPVMKPFEGSEPSKGYFVSLRVYDILGKEVATLVKEQQPAGSYEVKFDASHLSSGVYFFKLTTNQFSSIRKMILVK